MNQTLEDVKETFSAWRAYRKSPREAIPQELWELAVQLTKHHSSHKVARTLGLNTSTLSKKCKGQRRSKVSAPTPSTEFIEIDL